MRLFYFFGADDENRTRVFALARRYSTIEPHLPLEGLTGFEPTVRELQSLALPFGHSPTRELYQISRRQSTPFLEIAILNIFCFINNNKSFFINTFNNFPQFIKIFFINFNKQHYFSNIFF